MRTLGAVVLLLGCSGEQPVAPISLADDFVVSEEDGAYPRRGGPSEPDRRVVYLNFEGGPLYCGRSDDAPANISTIICNVSYPSFDENDFNCDDRQECIDEIVTMVRERWRDFAIEFVTERPEEGNYDMVMIGGVVEGGAAGVSPLDCRDFRPINIVFAFSGVVAGPGKCAKQQLVTVITHELTHSMGICHNDDCDPPVSGVMCPRIVTCETDWGAGCQVDECPCYLGCTDPHEMLLEVLGPAETDPPVVEVVSPPSGKAIPCEGFKIWVDVTDETAVGGVFLFEGGRQLGVIHVPPFVFSVGDVVEGERNFRLVAFDTIGNRTEQPLRIDVECGADCIVGSCCCGVACCEPVCECLDKTRTGGACEEDADCRGHRCISLDEYPGEGDACSELCTLEGTCPTGFLCVEEDGEMVCREDVWADTGEPCAEDTDCETGLCVDAGKGGRCTIPCSVEDAGACPQGLVCRSLEEDEDAVCLARASGGGACQMAPSPGFPGAWWILLAWGLARRRR